MVAFLVKDSWACEGPKNETTDWINKEDIDTRNNCYYLYFKQIK